MLVRWHAGTRVWKTKDEQSILDREAALQVTHCNHPSVTRSAIHLVVKASAGARERDSFQSRERQLDQTSGELATNVFL
jgi:hypothetical protein